MLELTGLTRRFGEVLALDDVSFSVAEGRLRSEVGRQVPWSDANAAIAALLERRVRGKAVLTLG